MVDMNLTRLILLVSKRKRKMITIPTRMQKVQERMRDGRRLGM